MFFSRPTPAALCSLPPERISRCSAQARLHFFPKEFDFLSVFLSGSKTDVCCRVGGPMSVTTKRSASATPFLPDQTAARKNPHLWEFSPFFPPIIIFIIALSPATGAHVSVRISSVDASSGLTKHTWGLCVCAPSCHGRMLTHKVNFRLAQLNSQRALGGFKSSGVTLRSFQSGATCRSLRVAQPEIPAARRHVNACEI